MAWFENDVADLYEFVRDEGECRIWTGPVIDGIPQAKFRGLTVDARQLALACYDQPPETPRRWHWARQSCANPLCVRTDHQIAQPKPKELLDLWGDTPWCEPIEQTARQRAAFLAKVRAGKMLGLR